MHLKPLNYFSPYTSSHCFITSSWFVLQDRFSLKSLALLIQHWMITPKPVSCPKRSQKHHHSLFRSTDKYYFRLEYGNYHFLWSILLAVHSSSTIIRAWELQGSTSFLIPTQIQQFWRLTGRLDSKYIVLPINPLYILSSWVHDLI